MADFRKWLYALAPVTLLAGLSVPASAQSPTSVVCNVQSATNNLIRTQGYTEQVGDVVIACTGGTPAPLGAPIPGVDIQLFLSLNVTSQITAAAAGGNFLDALLIIDEPNSPINPGTPILNCGNTGTTQSLTAGPGVCTIISTGPVGNGSPNTYNGTTTGSGHPNVFQGRQALNGLSQSSIVFQGVPFDAPGTATRLLRFTNVRVNATQLGVASPTAQIPVTMGITSSGSASLPLAFLSLAVATAQTGVTVAADSSTASNFAQCLGSFNGSNNQANLFKSAASFATCTSTGTGLIGGAACTGTPTTVSSNFLVSNTTPTPSVRFSEGFSSSWKPKNISQTQNNGSVVNANYIYNGSVPPGIGNAGTNTAAYLADLNQNVPGINYFTESGFQFNSNNNPTPVGFVGSQVNMNQFSSAGASSNTGISNAGIATQGTRLALQLTNIPQGVSLFVPPVVFLYRQGQNFTTSATINNGSASGVAVLTLPPSSSTAGDGPYNPPTGTGALTSLFNAFNATATSGTTATVVYEVLFTDPFANEYLDVPVVVAYNPALNSNPPLGLPAPNTTVAFAGGFAPFYTAAAAGVAETLSATATSTGYPIPRFLFQGQGGNLFLVSRCSCNLLFPFVTQQSGFDTGIAIANTSADNLGPAGAPMATPQEGTVTFWYYGTVGANGPPPPAQTTSVSTPVQAGTVLTYTLSQGNSLFGLDNRGANFQGYLITTSQFQYCHGFAFISSLVAGPTTTGLSEGYLALVLDANTLGPRGNVQGESLNQ